jgi:putative ABC transport system permease protein
MFRNYLKTIWRNLLTNKIHSFINITGLSVGMAVALLIGLWVKDEISFNTYHNNYNCIAQVMEQNTMNGEVKTRVNIPPPLAPSLQKNFGSDFKHIVIASWTEQHTLTVGERKLSFSGDFMGPEGPEMFTLKMIKGSLNGLNDPSSILISSTVAYALFGNKDPLGQIIKIDNSGNLKVTGVYEDIPKNSSFYNLKFIGPWDYYKNSHDWVKNATDNWYESSFQLFVQLAENTNMQDVSLKIRDIKLKNVNNEGVKYKPVILLHPMSKWHLYSEFKNGFNTGGAIQYVRMFKVIGIFVLLLACINFMNISTARSEKRAKEVGIRKAIGSFRSQLMFHFFCESLLMALVSFCIAVILVQVSLPFFNILADKQISIPFANPLFWIICFLFIFLTGLVAGIYPALYLSAFKPVKVLKGSFKVGRSAGNPRKILVVTQFAVSVILIIGTIVVFKQIQYAKDRPVGYTPKGLIGMQIGSDEIEKNFDALASELKSSGIITEIARASTPLTAIHSNRNDVLWKEKNPNLTYDFGNLRVTSDYGKTINWKFLLGRDFSDTLISDSSSVIVNEAAVKYMGLNDPIGETVRFNNQNYTIIGVVKDMVMTSPYDPARQTLFYLSARNFDNIVMRINPASGIHESISKLSSVFKKYAPSVPLIYNFVDNEYASKFENEERLGKLATVFSILAIFISCLGLFGMATFTAEQRIKEIGIRKVLGASVVNLWSLLSKEFVVLVLIALIIAIPLASFLMNKWLQNYQYRTDIPFWVFAIAGIGAISITLFTVSFQSIRAALTNPVNCLRSE